MDKNLLVGGEMHLYGDVGDTWSGDNFMPSDVANGLAAHGDGDVTVRLNSGGGIATDGMAIYSLLKAHPGKVHIKVDGIAASAASLIAMAGDTRSMRQGAMLMIHDPATVTVGNVDAHQKKIDTLDKLANNYAGVYARASGKTTADTRAIMKSETWLTADEAKKDGFTTAVEDEPAIKASAFDYRIYMRAPATLPQRSRREVPAVPVLHETAPDAAIAASARMRARQL
jgi:ATP-dependent protease ClpP protease subunit